jgi:hypothetical protein
MEALDFSKGDKVLFGRSHGEQTLGEVVKVNRVKVKVKQLESRGTYRSYPVGTIWTVPATLLSKTDSSAVMPKEEAPKKPKRSDADILSDIRRLYNMLSPENLHCDGEISVSAARRRGAEFNRQLRACFVELGRRVSEEEAYNSGR